MVTISGADASDFTVTSTPTSAITAGNTSSFTITFTPLAAGLRTATITIPSNDPDNPSYTFNIQGTGVAATTATNGLMVATTVAGSGTPAFPGAELTVNYTGFLTDGSIFDSSDPTINPGRTPFQTPLGVGQVIAGWDQGLIGMKPGETRILLIPGALAYPNGQGSIPAGAPLIFVVSEVSVQAPAISLQANGITIANGDKSPSIADSTDFQQMTYTPDNSTASTINTVSRTFGVTDSTTGAIVFTGTAVTISGANAADFAVTSQPIPGVPNGSLSPFTISFTPHGAGTRTALVTVHSTDPATPSYSFTIHGTGVKTTNSASDHLEIGELAPGTAVITTQSAVFINYTGWLADGTPVFDSSAGGPLELAVTGGTITGTILQQATDGSLQPAGTLFQGMTEGLQGIKAGESRLLIMPAALGPFGASANGNIPANATLFMTVSAESQQVVVFANETLITAGETSATLDNATLIGTIVSGSTVSQLMQDYQLQAGGNNPGALQITSPKIKITGSGASAFQSTNILGSQTEGTFFTVTFAPKTPGTYSAIVHVETNDPVNPDFQFTVSATQTPWNDLTGTLGKINFPTSGSLTSGAPNTYTIPLTLTNHGNQTISNTASASSFQVFLHNTNSTSNSSDIMIANSTSTTLRGLAANKTKTISLPVSVPITVPAGNYQVLAEFNGNAAITETNATNNTLTAAGVIHVTQGFNNLTTGLGSISLPAAPIIGGSTTTVNLPVTITNNGNITVNPASPPITFNIYLHNPNATANADTLISTQTSNSLRGLAVGKTAKLTLNTALPLTTPAGSYEFIVKVNENAAITETTFADNNASSSQSVVVSAGFNNLTTAIGPISLPTGSAITGASTLFKIPVTVTNNGNVTVSSASPPITFNIYAHNATGGTDILIATQTSNSLSGLAVGKTAKLTLTTALPITLPDGNYDFRVAVNENTAITESNFSDNSATSLQTFNASQGFYDLSAAIGAPVFPVNSPVISGNTTAYKIPLTITNLSNLPIAANAAPVSVNVYLHNATGGPDTLISSATTAGLRGLAVGKSVSMTLSPTIPITVPGGDFQFVVKVDENNGITDSVLSNNDPLSNQTFSVAQGVYNISGSLSTSTFATALIHDVTFSGKLTATIINASNITLPKGQLVNVQLVARQSNGSIIPIGAATTVSLSSLAPGKTVTVSLNKSLAGGLDAGSYIFDVQLAPLALTQSTTDDLISNTPTGATFPVTVT